MIFWFADIFLKITLTGLNHWLISSILLNHDKVIQKEQIILRLLKFKVIIFWSINGSSQVKLKSNEIFLFISTSVFGHLLSTVNSAGSYDGINKTISTSLPLFSLAVCSNLKQKPKDISPLHGPKLGIRQSPICIFVK